MLNEGRLFFKEKRDITHLLYYLNNKDIKSVRPLRDIPYVLVDDNFISLTKAIDTMRKKNLHHFLQPYPMSNFNSSILNQNGEIQVGDSIYVVKGDFVEVYPAANFGKLNKNIVINSIQKTTSTNTCTFEQKIGNSTYRLRGTAFINFYGYLAEAGVASYWEKRRKFLLLTFWDSTWDYLNQGQGYRLFSLSATPIFSPPYDFLYGGGTTQTVHSTNFILDSPSFSSYVIPPLYTGTRISGQISAKHEVRPTSGHVVSCDSFVAEWWY